MDILWDLYLICTLPDIRVHIVPEWFLSQVVDISQNIRYFWHSVRGTICPSRQILPIDIKQQSMVGKYKVITLCGSTKFKEQYLEAQKRLTLEGNIVISVGLFGHSGDDEVWTEGTKAMLDDMHKRKIDMADEIFIINVGGYIGESTRNEIAYAKSQGIAVRYLE